MFFLVRSLLALATARAVCFFTAASSDALVPVFDAGLTLAAVAKRFFSNVGLLPPRGGGSDDESDAAGGVDVRSPGFLPSHPLQLTAPQ
jgi:hypothetical protein